MAEPAILICGFGAFGRMHAAAWRRVRDGARLMVADPQPAARQAAMAAGIRREDVVADLSDAIGRADVVDVVAPLPAHFPLAMAAIEAGKPVLLEKPAVPTIEEAETLAAAAGNLPVQINFVLRAHPMVARARALLAGGAIGSLVALEGDFSGWKRMRPDSGILWNDGVHFLDLMRVLVGASGTPRDVEITSLLSPEVVDDLRMRIDFANGAVGRLRLGILAAGSCEDGFVPGALTTKTLRLVGTGGNIILDFNRNQLSHAEVVYHRSPGGFDVRPKALRTETVLGASAESLLAGSFERFLGAVKSDVDVLCDLQEGAVEMTRLLHAIEAMTPVPGRAS
jgi:predicted dehydrogenase